MEETVLTFDRNGYVVPYTLVDVDWNTFVQTFGFASHRQTLLTAYKDFLAALAELLPVKHRHWVDGSFGSDKMEPGDIDVIVFVPHTHFTNTLSQLKQLKKDSAELIDCYFVETFPPDHAKFEISRADELDWFHFLRTDRRKRPKGILELWYNYGDK